MGQNKHTVPVLIRSKEGERRKKCPACLHGPP
ncbi:hypothetical protein HaLaN_29574, partial [Haematococcus lacustris]